MSKRFTAVASEIGMHPVYDNLTKKSLNVFEVVKLLNSYGVKVNCLKRDFTFKDNLIRDLKYSMNRLSDENEDLKQSLLSTSKELQYGVKKVQRLAKENEQLKQQVSEQGTQIDFLKDENKHMRDLVNENEQLKQTLKDSYINEICENCKYGHYYLSDNFDGGFEGDFECLKKHFDNEHWKCDGLKECDDFELDFKGDVE